LLDPMRRDLMKDRRAKEPVQGLKNLAVAFRALLVQIGVVPQIYIRERFERDIRLTADPVATIENPRSLARFYVLRLSLVGGLSTGAVAASVHPEVVMPVVLAPWRRSAQERIR
jgi:hypothetical protein